MEETEDQALVPDATPNLIDLIKGLDIADQHIESLQVSYCINERFHCLVINFIYMNDDPGVAIC